MHEPEEIQAETLRLGRVLAAKIKERGVSVRSLEKKAGVAEGIFSKALKGQITLQMKHVLQICDALELGWRDFFLMAYPPFGATGNPMEDQLVEILYRRFGMIPDSEKAKEPPSEPKT